MKIRQLILQRCRQLIPVLLGVSVLTFFLMQTASSDAVDRIYERQDSAASAEIKEKERKKLKLDQPLYIQYFSWLKGAVLFDMGVSFISEKPVVQTMKAKLPNTLLLSTAALLLALAISLPLGFLAACYQNRWPDYLIRLFSFAGNSLPGFLVAYLLLYIFVVRLNLFSVVGVQSSVSFILPAVTLAFSISAKYIRQIRMLVITEFNQPYVEGAEARGVTPIRVLIFSILPPVSYSLLTFIGLSFGSLLGGTAVVELIFNWDGIGKLAVDAIRMADYPMIQAYTLWTAVIYVFIHLIIDILYHFFDPRVRLEGESLNEVV